MKAKITIEEGESNIILTPETQFEKTLIEDWDDNKEAVVDVKKKQSFYPYSDSRINITLRNKEIPPQPTGINTGVEFAEKFFGKSVFKDMQENKRVWLIVAPSGVIVGCFDSFEKAHDYRGLNKSSEIKELEVL